MPVLHDPELVVNVQSGNPDGVTIFSRSKIAGPSGIVRFAVLKLVIGNEVPISVIVPAVEKIWSMPNRLIPVTAPAQTADPAKLRHGALEVMAKTPPCMLLALRTPPPPSGMAAANISLGPTAKKVKPTIANINWRKTVFGNRILCPSPRLECPPSIHGMPLLKCCASQQ